MISICCKNFIQEFKKLVFKAVVCVIYDAFESTIIESLWRIINE